MKKQMSFLAVMVGLTMVLFSAGAYAADPVVPAVKPVTHDPQIMERFANQQRRIDDGVKKGTLTKDEATLVQDNLNRIKDKEAKLAADGKLTPEEKKILNDKLDMNGEMIKSQKKNVIRRID